MVFFVFQRGLPPYLCFVASMVLGWSSGRRVWFIVGSSFVRGFLGQVVF